MKNVLLFLFSFIVIVILTIFITEKCVEKFKALNEHDKKAKEILDIVKTRLAKIYPNINELNIRESTKSETFHKRDIYLCIRDKENNFYDINTIMYVALHELSHVLDKEGFGHDDNPYFEGVFEETKKKGIDAGIYDPKIGLTDGYCGYF
ncbi:hypothetical protein OAF54_03410 [bacterium]|nr:hypothetical protein [bacterium]